MSEPLSIAWLGQRAATDYFALTKHRILPLGCGTSNIVSALGLNQLRKMYNPLREHANGLELLLYVHADMEADARDMPGFVPAAKYAAREAISPYEIGGVERLRVLVSPHLPVLKDAGGKPEGFYLVSSGGVNCDLYTVIVAPEGCDNPEHMAVSYAGVRVKSY